MPELVWVALIVLAVVAWVAWVRDHDRRMIDDVKQGR